MRKITNTESLRNVNGGGIVSSFIIGFVLKRTVVSIYNYYYNKGQGR